MTYGTFTAIKQALEALNLRESVFIQVTNGVVDIFDKETYIDSVKEELREELYDEFYSEGYHDGFNDGEELLQPKL